MKTNNDYVSLETAKLLRGVGYKTCLYMATYDDQHRDFRGLRYDDRGDGYWRTGDPSQSMGELIPALCDCQKWLREVHKIHIEVLYDYEYDTTPYHYYIRELKQENGRPKWREDFTTYELALDSAIAEACCIVQKQSKF